jgi:hypothetical protein
MPHTLLPPADGEGEGGDWYTPTLADVFCCRCMIVTWSGSNRKTQGREGWGRRWGMREGMGAWGIRVS